MVVTVPHFASFIRRGKGNEYNEDVAERRREFSMDFKYSNRVFRRVIIHLQREGNTSSQPADCRIHSIRAFFITHIFFCCRIHCARCTCRCNVAFTCRKSFPTKRKKEMKTENSRQLDDDGLHHARFRQFQRIPMLWNYGNAAGRR